MPTHFYTDALHLSKEFIGTLAGWGSAGAIVGILLCQIAPRTLRLRPLATIATVMYLLNFLPLLAVHDARSAIWGVTASAVIVTVAGFTYSWMFSRACPKGVEATIFGMLGAVQAFCYLLCDWLGTHLYEWFGPASHHTARYGWYASVLTCLAIGLPLLAMLPFLPKDDLAGDIPNDIDDHDHLDDSASEFTSQGES